MASITNCVLEKFIFKFHSMIEVVQFIYFSIGPVHAISACHATTSLFALVTGDDDVIIFHSDVPRAYSWPMN